VFFLSCKANSRVKLAKSGHGPHLFRIVIFVVLLSLCCSVVVIMLYSYCVALLLFVLSYVLIVCTVPLPPGVNPIAVDKYIYINVTAVPFWPCNSTVYTDLHMYTGFIPTQLMTNTSGCYYSL